MTIWVVIIIAIALAFDFFNGFHDAANSIATVVSTRVLSPQQAVVWAAFFNFVAFMIFGTKVAATIANDVVNPTVLNNAVIFAGLVGAIAWDILTWWIGLPTSSSHALVGAMAGAAVAEAGWGALIASGFQKIAVFIVLSPIVGLAARVHVHGRRSIGSSTGGRSSRSSTEGSAWVSCSRPPRSAWGTARTTRRRRWASSWRC